MPFIPRHGAPFLDARGQVAREWRDYLQKLSSDRAIAGLQAQIDALKKPAGDRPPITNADLADADTTGLKEGVNLYFTPERAREAVGPVGGGGVLPMVNGETPPVLMYGGNQLIYARVE